MVYVVTYISFSLVRVVVCLKVNLERRKGMSPRFDDCHLTIALVRISSWNTWEVETLAGSCNLYYILKPTTLGICGGAVEEGVVKDERMKGELSSLRYLQQLLTSAGLLGSPNMTSKTWVSPLWLLGWRGKGRGRGERKTLPPNLSRAQPASSVQQPCTASEISFMCHCRTLPEFCCSFFKPKILSQICSFATLVLAKGASSLCQLAVLAEEKRKLRSAMSCV